MKVLKFYFYLPTLQKVFHPSILTQPECLGYLLNAAVYYTWHIDAGSLDRRQQHQYHAEPPPEGAKTLPESYVKFLYGRTLLMPLGSSHLRWVAVDRDRAVSA